MKIINASVLVFVLSTVSFGAQAAGWWDDLKAGAKKLGDNASEMLSDKEQKSTEKPDVTESADVPAQKEPVPQAAENAQVIHKAPAVVQNETVRRKPYSVNLAVAPLNAPFPLAYGLSASYAPNSRWLYGLAYTKSTISIKAFSFDLGEVKEQNTTLFARRFVGSKFNFLMGLSHRELSVKFPKDWFDVATGGFSETFTRTQTTLLQLGLGHRWTWKNRYAFYVDWLTLNIPLDGNVKRSAERYAKSEDDRKTIRDSEEILSWYPSGGFLQMQIGMIF